MNSLNRRNFLKTWGVAVAGAVFSLTHCGKSSDFENPPTNSAILPQKSRVAKCARPDIFSLRQKPSSKAVSELLDATLCKLFDVKDAREGLRTLFTIRDTVAIKVNCLSGRQMSTHPELAWAVVELLKKIGIKEDNILIWDRYDSDIQRAGFQLNKGGGVKVYGADYAGYGSELVAYRSLGSFFTDIIKNYSKIIDLPVLKDHGIVGVTLSLKNFFGAIHNPNKYHPNNGDPYVADLFSYPPIRNKVKLSIVDGIVGQYEGGPPPQPQWQWNFGGLLAGTDLVAVDRIGLDILEGARAKNGLPSLTAACRFPNYLITAEKLGLGNFQRAKIDLIER